MKAGYRYRIEPTVTQRAMLARTFGCCRVVFNDAVRIQREARRVEENVSPTEVQRRVITEAKSREDRAWLGEVASVALVQSVRDAHRAHRNFIDSISGQRSGRKMGPPRFKSRKGNWQSFRLTRNGFAIRPNGQLYLAKIGEVMVRWSRELPSPPSSVTIIQEPDGHCYASFVVEVGRKQLVPVVQEAGVDLGITRLATVATTAGTCWEAANPNHLAGKRRKLARLEREKARRAKGGKNRAKSRLKVAAQHGRVARARRVYHHKQALRLVRENQAIYVEDLNVVGMVRNRHLAYAISDAGWGQFIRLVTEKAERYGRTMHKVSRWFPSSKKCSACGAVRAELPLKVRDWTCKCGFRHDRDHNAAINILAAGRAERIYACGAPVRPLAGEAGSDETGSIRTPA